MQLATRERRHAAVEDALEASSLSELDILEELATEEFPNDEELATIHAKVRERLLMTPEQVAEATAEMRELRGDLPRATWERPKASRKYRLIRDDVAWSTVPQVHAIMRILKTVANVGQEVDEEQIVAAMRANPEVLGTKQDPKRIWDYYKGNSAEGLQAHGVVERI